MSTKPTNPPQGPEPEQTSQWFHDAKTAPPDAAAPLAGTLTGAASGTPPALRGNTATPFEPSGHAPGTPAQFSGAQTVQGMTVDSASGPLPPVPQDFPKSFGDYDLLEEVASGGMGVVYRARQRSLNRLVALKMIRQDHLESDTAVQRFHQEARAAAALDHPNIVPIFEIGHRDGRHYFTMAFIEGTSLKSRVAKNKPVPASEAVALLLPVIDAVAFAHDHGIVHRDLKPDNIMLDPKGRPRVTDFGLAKRLEGDINLTNPGQIVGTPAYMSPEQALGGDKKIGPASDIYSLGCILYCLLTGQPPFYGASITEVLCKIVTEAPAPLRQLRADIPPRLEAICMQCLEKDPARRFGSAAALAAAIRELDLGSPTDVLTPSAKAQKGASHTDFRAPSPHKTGSSRSLLVGLLAVGLIVAVMSVGVGLAFSLGMFHHEPASPKGGGTEPEVRNALLDLPPATRKDFGLRADLIGGIADKNGVQQFVKGQKVSFNLSVDQDAFVGIWTLEADGTVVQVFPNEHEQDNQVKKGQMRTVPGNTKYIIEATLTNGVEEVRVVASTKAWNPLRGQKDGPYLVFKSAEERSEFQDCVRGLIVKTAAKGHAAVADESIRYQVVSTAQELRKKGQ